MAEQTNKNNKPPSKGVFLTIPEPMLQLLEKEKEKYMYHTIQELILEAVRDKFVRYRKSTKPTKRGRPKKGSEMDFLKRRTVFHEDGVTVD